MSADEGEANDGEDDEDNKDDDESCSERALACFNWNPGGPLARLAGRRLARPDSRVNGTLTILPEVSFRL